MPDSTTSKASDAMSMATGTCAGVETPETELANQLVDLLKCPGTYRDRTSAVEFLETHISWLFLTDHFVYKLKKPVRFDFLDFSTVEQRKVACHREVELNRRLAREVYLGVVPIVKTARGCLALDQPGKPVDWVVKMHRLPSTKSLDVLLQAGNLNARAVESVASRLTQFYGQLPPVALAVADYHGCFERHVIANRDELLAVSHHLDADQVARIHARQLRLLRLAPDLLADRVLDGRIVEGHGDLRPEHVYLTSPPVMIDCIEFSREFRTLDVADELSFLVMECEALGAGEIGEQILQHYMRVSGDHPPERLLSFYPAYRACVRAKVFALRADQVTGSEQQHMLSTAQVYLDLAEQYALKLGPPVVVMVRGMSGTGKSTVAALISQEIGSPLLQTDVVRRELFPSDAPGRTYNDGRYSPTNREKVYHEMHARARLLVAHGSSVVLDATYLTEKSRSEVMEIAARNGAELLCVRCECADDVAAERITSRAMSHDVISEVRPEFLQRQRESDEPDPPGLTTLVVDTSAGTVEPRRAILAALRNICLPGEINR